MVEHRRFTIYIVSIHNTMHMKEFQFNINLLNKLQDMVP